MIRFSLLSLSILLVSSNVLANEVICTPTIPRKLDPQQVQFPVEEYLSSLAYKSLLPTEKQKEGIAESWESTDQVTWKIKIRKNIKFNTFESWKPTRGLDSSDVVFSIKRQLSKEAITLLDLNTFNEAKYNGLEKALLSVKASSAHEVTLSFNKKTSQEELNRYFETPVGYVLSKEFYDSMKKTGKRVNFFPTSTELNFSVISINQISLVPNSEISKPDKKGTFVFKGLRTHDTNLKIVKEMGCKRVYYGGKSLTDDLTKNNRRFRKQNVSRTKVFLRLNSKIKFPNADLLELQWLASPEKLSSLKDMELAKGLFNKSSPFIFAGKQSPPIFKQPVDVKDLVSCELPQLSGKNSNLIDELKKILTRTLKYKVYGVTTQACELLPAFTENSSTLGSLSSFTYKDQQELIMAFGCDHLARKPFGFCVPGKLPTEKDIEAGSLNFMRVFPLLDVENFFIYIF